MNTHPQLSPRKPSRRRCRAIMQYARLLFVLLPGIVLGGIAVGYTQAANATVPAPDVSSDVSDSVYVGRVNASSNGVQYSLLGGNVEMFSIGATNGVISFSGEKESETVVHTFLVVARTRSGLTASVMVKVIVGAEEANTPPQFVPATYAFNMNDTQVLAGHVRATDTEGDTLSYSLASGAGGVFSVGGADGAINYYGGTIPGDLRYTLQVSASDEAGASASATVTVLVYSTAVINRRTQMAAAVLADVGRNMALDALEVIGGRFDAGAHITLSGNALNMKRWTNGEWASGQWAKQLTDPWNGQWKREWTQLSRWMDWDYWQRSSGKWNGKERELAHDLGLGKRWDQLESEWYRQWNRVEGQWHQLRKGIVSGSSFLTPLRALSNGGSGASTGLSGWTVWGKGHVSGYQRVSDGVTSKGRVLSGYLGADYQASRELLLGVAVSRSKGDGYAEDSQGRIDVDTTMTAVWPYARWDSGKGVSLWGSIGRGSGTAEIDQQRVESDIEMAAAMFGVKRRVLLVGNTQVSVKADWFDVEIESDAVVGYLNPTRSGAHRLRLALSASSHWRLSKTARSRAGVEFGVRADGGDSVKGQGLDMGIQFGYSDAALGLAVSSRARVLVAHSEDYREWGLDASVALKPGMLGRGLSLKLLPRWGHAAASINQLWASGVTALQRSNASGRGLMPDHTRLSLSYGVGYRGAVLRPYTSLNMQRDTMARLELGLKLNSARMQLSISGNQAHDVGISGTLRW